MARRAFPLIIVVPDSATLRQRHSPLARAAGERARGNGAGIHGGKKPRYRDRERQVARREERAAYLAARKQSDDPERY